MNNQVIQTLTLTFHELSPIYLTKKTEMILFHKNL